VPGSGLPGSGVLSHKQQPAMWIPS
jgi:hypothetical protein